MTTIELVEDVLKELGLRPKIEDGLIRFMYQMKQVYCVFEEDTPDYVAMILPSFLGIVKDDIPTAMYVCNKATRELRQIKVYLAEDLESLTSSVEFYYDTRESVKKNIEHGLEVTSVIGTWITTVMADYNIQNEDSTIQEPDDDESSCHEIAGT